MKMRTIRVITRYSADEAETLDKLRGKVSRGAYQRKAVLNEIAPIVPEINREAWASLGKSLSSLNQLAKAMHARGGMDAEIAAAVTDELLILRSKIVGKSP